MEQWNILLDWDGRFKETQRSLTGFNSDLNSTFNGFTNRIMAIQASQPAAIPSTFERVMTGAGAGVFGVGVGTGKQIMNSQLKKLITKNTILGNKNKQLQGYLSNIQKAPMGLTPDSVKYLKFNKPTMKKFKSNRVASIDRGKTDLRRDNIHTERIDTYTDRILKAATRAASKKAKHDSYLGNREKFSQDDLKDVSKLIKAINGGDILSTVLKATLNANKDQQVNFNNSLKLLNDLFKTREKTNF